MCICISQQIYIYIYEVCSKLFHRLVLVSELPGCLPEKQPSASVYLPGLGLLPRFEYFGEVNGGK